MPRRNALRAHLTPNEVAELLLVNPVTVRQWASRGLLRSLTTPGGHRRFALQDVEEFARQRGVTPTAGSSGRPERVLVVQAQLASLGTAVHRLRITQPFLTIEVVGDALEAGLRLESLRPHALVLEAGLPGLDTPNVVRRLRGRPALSRIRVITVGGPNRAAADAEPAASTSGWLPADFLPEQLAVELGLGASALLG